LPADAITAFNIDVEAIADAADARNLNLLATLASESSADSLELCESDGRINARFCSVLGRQQHEPRTLDLANPADQRSMYTRMEHPPSLKVRYCHRPLV
jgi:hypothetical protein